MVILFMSSIIILYLFYYSILRIIIESKHKRANEKKIQVPLSNLEVVSRVVISQKMLTEIQMI